MSAKEKPGGGPRRRRRPSELESILGVLASLTATSGSTFAVVVGLTGISYGLFFFLGRSNPNNFFYTAFCQRGPYPPICTFLFFTAQCLLLRKYHFVLKEWRAFDLESELFPQDSGTTLAREGAEAIAAKVQMLQPGQRGALLIQRVDRGLQRLRNTGSSSDMSGILNDLSTIDRQTAESGYTFVRFLVAVIPIVGFIGTVLGISEGISGFAKAIQGASDFAALKDNLREVTKGLGVAFEATFVALLESAFIMLVSAIVQKREDDLLTAIDDFCILRILNRLKVGDAGGQGGGDAVSRELSAISIALAERSHDVESAVREIGQEICVWLKRMSTDGRPPAGVPPPGAPVRPATRVIPPPGRPGGAANA